MAVIEVEPYANQVQRFYFEELKWCGCGNPADALAFMRDALEALWNKSEAGQAATHGEIINGTNPAYEAASAREKELLPLDCPLALSYRYMLCAHDLTEHGGSVYGSWLTDKGNAVLAMLSSAGDLEDAMDDEDYPPVVSDTDRNPKGENAEGG